MMKEIKNKKVLQQTENIQSSEKGKKYTKPSVNKLGKMQKLTLKGGSSFDDTTWVNDFPGV